MLATSATFSTSGPAGTARLMVSPVSWESFSMAGCMAATMSALRSATVPSRMISTPSRYRRPDRARKPVRSRVAASREAVDLCTPSASAMSVTLSSGLLSSKLASSVSTRSADW